MLLLNVSQDLVQPALQVGLVCRQTNHNWLTALCRTELSSNAPHLTSTKIIRLLIGLKGIAVIEVNLN